MTYQPVPEQKRRRAFLWVSAARAMMDKSRSPAQSLADVIQDALHLAGGGDNVVATVMEDLKEVCVGSLTDATPATWKGAFPNDPDSTDTVERLMAFEGSQFKGSIIRNSHPEKYAWWQRILIVLYRRHQKGAIRASTIHLLPHEVRASSDRLVAEYQTLNREIAVLKHGKR